MPQDEQTVVGKELVFRRWDYFVFSLLTSLNLVVVCSFLLYRFSPVRWQANSIVVWLFTFQLMSLLATQQFRWCLLPFMKKPTLISPRPGWKVGVATTFVPGLESLEMLEKTVAALVAMKYPHDTWVLDEGDHDEVKALCLRLGAHHFTRKHLTQYQTTSGSFEARTKHGNYNTWLAEIGYVRYDIITGFDPDHVPYPEFLHRVLGFFNDPQVAYAQAPQVYYNQPASFIARGAAEETYSYYSSTQMASYHLSYPIITGLSPITPSNRLEAGWRLCCTRCGRSLNYPPIPCGVIFFQRESDPPLPAKKIPPTLIPIQPRFMPFIRSFGEVTRQRHKQLCGVGAIGFAVDEFSQSGPS